MNTSRKTPDAPHEGPVSQKEAAGEPSNPYVPRELEQEAAPAVWIFICEGEAGRPSVAYVLSGLEEEAIPARLRTVAPGPARRLAREAAEGSPLGVGIGLDGARGEAVLHHRDLPAERPLHALAGPDYTAVQLRLLGTNAARLVKGNPLRFADEPAAGSEG